MEKEPLVVRSCNPEIECSCSRGLLFLFRRSAGGKAEVQKDVCCGRCALGKELVSVFRRVEVA